MEELLKTYIRLLIEADQAYFDMKRLSREHNTSFDSTVFMSNDIKVIHAKATAIKIQLGKSTQLKVPALNTLKSW